MEIYVSAGIRTSDPRLSSRTPTPLCCHDIYLRLKLLQYCEVTGNVGGNSGKINTRECNAMYQIDYGYIYVLPQTVRQNMHFFHKAKSIKYRGMFEVHSPEK